MRRRNKSAAYGYYGGVSSKNHYVPPDSENYVPQPPKAQLTEKDILLLRKSEHAVNFVNSHSSNILLRVNTSSQPDNIDTFMITTSGRPEDVIIYTSDRDQVVLDDLAGTGIIDNPTNEPLDGGTF
jgi:hypothetical protein